MFQFQINWCPNSDESSTPRYVHKARSGGPANCSRLLCWLLGVALLAGAVAVAVLIGTGVIDPGLAKRKVGRTLGGAGNFPGGLKTLDRANSPNVLTNNPDFFNKANPALPPNTVANAFEGQLRITNMQFDKRLEDPSAEIHRSLAARLEQDLSALLQPILQEVLVVKVRQFTEGSIVVHYSFAWNTPRQESKIKVVSLGTVLKRLIDQLKRDNGFLFGRFAMTKESLRVGHTKKRCGHLDCSHDCGFNYRELSMECSCPEEMQKTGSSCNPIFPAVPNPTTVQTKPSSQPGLQTRPHPTESLEKANPKPEPEVRDEPQANPEPEATPEPEPAPTSEPTGGFKTGERLEIEKNVEQKVRAPPRPRPAHPLRPKLEPEPSEKPDNKPKTQIWLFGTPTEDPETEEPNVQIVTNVQTKQNPNHASNPKGKNKVEDSKKELISPHLIQQRPHGTGPTRGVKKPVGRAEANDAGRTRLAVGDGDPTVPTSLQQLVPEQPESPREISAISNPFIVLPTDNLALVEEEEDEGSDVGVAVVHPLGAADQYEEDAEADFAKTTSSNGAISSSVPTVSSVGSILNGSFLFSSEEPISSAIPTTIETTTPFTTTTTITTTTTTTSTTTTLTTTFNSFLFKESNAILF